MGERQGRDFLKGIDFGLPHKMTTGLRVLTGRSLHAEDAHSANRAFLQSPKLVLFHPWYTHSVMKIPTYRLSRSYAKLLTRIVGNSTIGESRLAWFVQSSDLR
jgi:hypothetical protein